MSKAVVYSDKAPSPIGPYSQAIAAGNMLFVSGQIAINKATGNVMTDDIQQETEQVMQNLQEILKAGGMDFGNVVKCSIFIKDMGKFARVNEIYGKYFITTPPARETIEVSGLPLNVNIEISCIAVK